MSEKIYYTIQPHSENSDEGGFIINLACESDYNVGCIDSYTFDDEVLEKIDRIDAKIRFQEVTEGEWECFTEKLKDLTDALDAEGFVCGSIHSEPIEME